MEKQVRKKKGGFLIIYGKVDLTEVLKCALDPCGLPPITYAITTSIISASL